MLFGSMIVKAAGKTLMKLTPGYTTIFQVSMRTMREDDEKPEEVQRSYLVFSHTGTPETISGRNDTRNSIR